MLKPVQVKQTHSMDNSKSILVFPSSSSRNGGGGGIGNVGRVGALSQMVRSIDQTQV